MLILAATPIGNLDDSSHRLREALLKADHIFVEDTRRASILFKHLGVHGKPRSFHEHSPASVLAHIGGLLQQGRAVVYISDAGMPGINDPGYELVRLAIEQDVEIDVLPGPCAAINALVLSGLPAHEFCFLGFFPAKTEKRKSLLNKLARIGMTTIFFEAPSRIRHTLSFLNSSLPEIPIALCREMTKRHQQILRGTPKQVAEMLQVAKGELVLVVGPVSQLSEQPDIRERYQALLAEGNSPAQSAKILAAEYRMPKREVYRLVTREPST